MAHFKIPDAEFLLSVPRVELAPKRPLGEIAFAGRSNVGKSSLINSLLNRKGIAMTSKTPGKTRLLNYYLIGKGLCYFVDLPGYGYAKVARSMKEEWAEHLEGYFRDTPRLDLAVLLFDIRHGLTPLDEQMVDAMKIYNRPWMAVLTKSDKLNTKELNESIGGAHDLLEPLGAAAIIPYSAENHRGRDELWKEIMKAVKK